MIATHTQTKKELFATIKDFFEWNRRFKKSKLELVTNPAKDLGADSLELCELSSRIQDKFGVCFLNSISCSYADITVGKIKQIVIKQGRLAA